MNCLFTRITSAVLLCILLSASTDAQTVIYTEDFGATTPTGWALVNNGTGNNWENSYNSATYAYNNSYCMRLWYTVADAADTWSFTQGISMVAGRTYKIDFYQRVRSATFAESMKVTVGTAQTVVAQTTTLYDAASLTNTTYANRTTSNYVCPATGTYYFAFNCYSAADKYALYVDNVRISETIPVITSSFNAVASGASVQAAFNNVLWNSTEPIFAVDVSGGAANKLMVELNTKADFTGTSYTQSFTGTYSNSKYDLTCSGLSSALPTTLTSYFARVKGSDDNGTTWSAWSSDTWVFTKGTSDEGFHYSTQAQFDQATLTSTSFGNFIVSNNNGTTANANDDYLEVNQGSITNTVTTNSDQYLTEGTANYSGASFDWFTIGSHYNSGQKEDYHATRFQSSKIPQGATVESAYLNFYASDDGSEPDQNSTNALYLKVRGVDQDNCNAFANSTNTTTGDPKNRVRTTASVDWDIAAAWSDVDLITSPNIKTVVQEIVDRASYAAGNALGLIVDYDGAAHGTNNRHRYLCTGSRNTTYRPYLTATYTGFTNEVKFASVNLSSVLDATNWDALSFDVDKSGCGACDVTFEVRNASNDALIASGNTSPLSLGSSTVASIYIVAQIKRNSSPKLNSFTLTANGSVLPIALLDFQATVIDKKEVYLHWETSTEVNNDFFTIERSKDGLEFEEVGVVDGSGTTSAREIYELSDYAPLSGISYYRLKQTDFDGNSTYHELRKVFIGSNAADWSAKLYPNPIQVGEGFSLQIEAAANEAVEIVVHDQIGKRVYSKKIEISSGQSLFTVSDSHLVKGSYVVSIIGTSGVLVQKLVVK